MDFLCLPQLLVDWVSGAHGNHFELTCEYKFHSLPDMKAGVTMDHAKTSFRQTADAPDLPSFGVVIHDNSLESGNG